MHTLAWVQYRKLIPCQQDNNLEELKEIFSSRRKHMMKILDWCKKLRTKKSLARQITVNGTNID
jgi:hypothetical protein